MASKYPSLDSDKEGYRQELPILDSDKEGYKQEVPILKSDIQTPTKINTSIPDSVIKPNENLNPKAPPIEFEMSDLDTKEDWIEQARIIYQDEEEKNFKGSDKELSSWFKNRHSALANDLTNVGRTAYKAISMSDEVKDAWLKSLNTYDRTNSDFSTFLRALYHSVTDPTVAGSIALTGGAGLFARFGGQKAAAKAVRALLQRFSFKDQVSKQITSRAGAQAAKDYAMKKAKSVTPEILTKSRSRSAKDLAKLTSKTLPVGGAGYGLIGSLGREKLLKEIDPNKDEIDPLLVAGGIAAGAAFGFGTGRILPRLTERVMRKRALNKLSASAAGDLTSATGQAVTSTGAKSIIEKDITGYREESNTAFENRVLSRVLSNASDTDINDTVEVVLPLPITTKQQGILKKLYDDNGFEIIEKPFTGKEGLERTLTNTNRELKSALGKTKSPEIDLKITRLEKKSKTIVKILNRYENLELELKRLESIKPKDIQSKVEDVIGPSSESINYRTLSTKIKKIKNNLTRIDNYNIANPPPQNFIATKIKDNPLKGEVNLPENRSKIEELTSKTKNIIYNDSGLGDFFADVNLAKGTRNTLVEKQIADTLRKFQNTIDKDLKSNSGEISNADLELIGRALQEDPDAMQIISDRGFTDTLNATKNLRSDIRKLQQELLDSGMIDTSTENGKELYNKIKNSMQGNNLDASLIETLAYTNRQYAAFENKNWEKVLRSQEDGPAIIQNAFDFIHQGNIAQYKNKINNEINPKIKEKFNNDYNQWKVAFDVGKAEAAQMPTLDLIPTKGAVFNKYVKDVLEKDSNNKLQTLLTRSSLAEAMDSIPRNIVSQSSRILSRREDIPEQIRLVLGEYKDPFNLYANTMLNLSRTITQYNYEKDIAKLIDAADPNFIGGRVAKDGLILSTGVKLSGKPSEGISGATRAGVEVPDIAESLTSPIIKREGDQTPLDIKISEIKRAGKQKGLSEEDIKAQISKVANEQPESALKKPLSGYKAYPEVAQAIEMGNELAPVINRNIQGLLTAQAYTKTSKTVYSTSALGRNYMGAGVSSIGAGYFNPKNLKEQKAVFKSLWANIVESEGDEVFEDLMSKNIYLGISQTGLDAASFKAVLKDAGRESGSFLNLEGPLSKSKFEPTRKLAKLNSKLVNTYQAMDDAWKMFAFKSEQKMQRQTLIDNGINPDEVVTIITSSTGNPIKITQLDLAASKLVRKTMQNYGNVPKLLKYARRIPFADFLAFKTEVARTSKDVLVEAYNDIKDGAALMKTKEKAVDENGKLTGLLKGQHQRSQGFKRLGSQIAAASIFPAISTAAGYMTYNSIFGDEEKPKRIKGTIYTQQEGLTNLLKQPFNAGANYIYHGPTENGKGRRTNLSYINPYANYSDLLTGLVRAVQQGKNVDQALTAIVGRTIIGPLLGFLGPSMLTKAINEVLFNKDDYGKDVTSSKEMWTSTHAGNILGSLGSAFTPGVWKSGQDVKTAIEGESKKELYENAPWFKILGGDKFGIRKGKTGKKIYLQDAITGMFGFKPEAYDINEIFPIKLKVLERERRDTKSIFKDLYQNKGIISKEDLLESYKKSLDTHFSYTQDMYDLIDQYRAAASFKNKKGIMEPATPQQIKSVVSKYGLFSNRFDKKSLLNILSNQYIPPEINNKDIQSYLKEAQLENRKPNFDSDIVIELEAIRNRYLLENIVKPNVFPAEGNE